MRFIYIILIALFAGSALGQPPENRVWMTWEQNIQPECPNSQPCKMNQRYITRLVEEPSTLRAQQLIGALDQRAQNLGQPIMHPDTPTWCQKDMLRATQLERMTISDKLAPLKGLEGIYIDLTKLTPPSTEGRDFGERLQEEALRRLKSAGVPILESKYAMENTPGQAQLNIYFSNTNPDTGCWFSVFASLSQTMVLTRDPSIKLKAGSWGQSGGYSLENPSRSEFDAILSILDQFIADYVAAQNLK